MVRSTPGGRALSVLAAAVLVVALIALLVNVFRGGDDTEPTTTTSDTTTTTLATLSEITPTGVTVSSQITASFGGSNLIDGDLTTEWQASQSATPLTIEFRWAQPVQIQYVEIYNIADQERFLRNYRIQGYKIKVDDSAIEYRNTLENEAGGPHKIDIASFETTLLTIEVLSNYPSQAIDGEIAFNELVVAEVKFWGTNQ